MMGIQEYLYTKIDLAKDITESRTGDLFTLVAEIVKDPDNVTDKDITNVNDAVHKQFNMPLSIKQTKDLIMTTIKDWPDLFEN